MTQAAQPTETAPGILEETFEALCRAPQLDLAARRIARFRLSRYFTIVELDDGNTGACMSYASDSDRLLKEKSYELRQALASDPLGRAAILGATGDLLLRSLAASLVSALSAPILRAGGDGSFLATNAPLHDPLGGAESALVIGFGGYMHTLATAPGVKRLHIADLSYPRRREEMDHLLDGYRLRRPELELTISDGHDTRARAAASETVAITGSALCNGSMEQLLAWSSGRRVIVQGQSAAIYPSALFARGASIVVTTLKPANLIDIADRGQHGDLLEGGLPWVYLAGYNLLAQRPAAAATAQRQ